MAVPAKLFSIATILKRGVDLYPELTSRWTNLQDYLQQFAADHTHSGGPDGAFITGSEAGHFDGETFTNTSFLDLDALTGGPGGLAAVATSLVSAVGHTVLVSVSASIQNATLGAATRVAARVSGATTIASSTARCLTYESSAADDGLQASYITVHAVNAGTNTFEMQAAVNSGTGQIFNPRLVVIPFTS